MTQLDEHRELKRRQKQREKEAKIVEKAAAAPAKPAKAEGPKEDDLTPNVSTLSFGMHCCTNSRPSNTLSFARARYRSCVRRSHRTPTRTSSRSPSRSLVTSRSTGPKARSSPARGFKASPSALLAACILSVDSARCGSTICMVRGRRYRSWRPSSKSTISRCDSSEVPALPHPSDFPQVYIC